MKKTVQIFQTYDQLIQINNHVVEKGFDWLFNGDWKFWFDIEELPEKVNKEIENGSELIYVINEDWDCRISWFDYKKEEWLNEWYKDISWKSNLSSQKNNMLSKKEFEDQYTGWWYGDVNEDYKIYVKNFENNHSSTNNWIQTCVYCWCHDLKACIWWCSWVRYNVCSSCYEVEKKFIWDLQHNFQINKTKTTWDIQNILSHLKNKFEADFEWFNFSELRLKSFNEILKSFPNLNKQHSIGIVNRVFNK